MNEDEIYQRLGRLTQQMYLGISKKESAMLMDRLTAYHTAQTERNEKLLCRLSEFESGEVIKRHRKKLQVLSDDFANMKNEIGSKYKVYIRGCGKAGKSTLLNALLSIDEAEGSPMGKVPMTFTIDTYTDELEKNQAEIRTVDSDGKSTFRQYSRTEARRLADKEDALFKESRERCRQKIEKAAKDVYLEQEIADIEYKIYKENLYPTTIREIKWGIGKNDFFHNCVLIDTPGLSQELRFTNVIEDVKEYETDGIIWVFNSLMLSKMEVMKAYRQEIQELNQIYQDKKVIAVINMVGTGNNDMRAGSPMWNRVRQGAEAVFGKRYGIDEVICVNAKLAYDGNLKQDGKDIADSNIAQLRQRINELFMEKNSKERLYERVKKISSCLDNYYREAESIKDELKRNVSRYEGLKLKIQNQESACMGMVRTQLDKIREQQMSVIKSNIEANLSRIEGLEEEDRKIQDTFLKKYIIQKDMLEKRVEAALEKCAAVIYERFRNQQADSIISEYRTQKYAVEGFKKNLPAVSDISKKREISIDLSPGFFVGLFNDLFGKDSAITKFIKEVKNSFYQPKDRIYDAIRRDLGIWINNVSLDDEIRDYSAKCFDTLQLSMAEVCGEYEKVKDLIFFMEIFLSVRTPIELGEVELSDILGG